MYNEEGSIDENSVIYAGGRINLVRILLLQIGGSFDYPHLLNDI